MKDATASVAKPWDRRSLLTATGFPMGVLRIVERRFATPFLDDRFRYWLKAIIRHQRHLLHMKIAVLSHKGVSNYYAATLMLRGHEVTLFGGGALHAYAIAGYLECDACLLLGDEPDVREIADYFEAAGKPVWRDLAQVPKDPKPNA